MFRINTDAIIEKKEYLILIYALSFIPLIFLSDFDITFLGMFQRHLGISGIFISCILGFVVFKWFSKDDFPMLENFFSFCCLICGVFGVLQKLIEDQHVMLGGNTNMSSNMIALLFPIALFKKKYFEAIIGLMGAICLCSRSVLIALIFVTFFWFVRSHMKRTIFLISIGLFSIIMMLVPNTNKFTAIFNYHETERYHLLEDSFKTLTFFGVGNRFREELGKVKSQYLEDINPRQMYDDPHNIYMGHLVKYGIIPTYLFFFMIFICLYTNHRGAKYALFGYLIWGFGSFDVISTNVILWPIIGMSLKDNDFGICKSYV